jgi:hypothetical protein
VYATATEDMDALTFRTPKLLRKFTSTQGKDKQPILEIDTEVALKGLGLTYEQFVDLCILCGCDYCSTIKGVGPKTALKLIRQYKSIDAVLTALRKDKSKKNDIPPDWQAMKIPVNPTTPAAEEIASAESAVDEAECKEEETVEAASAVIEDGDYVVAESKEGELTDVTVDVVVPRLEESEEGLYEIVPPLYEQARKLFVAAEVTGTFMLNFCAVG